MLDTSDVDIEEARRFVRKLREGRDERHAQLIERLIAKVLAETESAEGIARREWMSTGEAARLLGVSPPTVKKWVQKGILDGLRLGDRVKVSRRSVMEYISRLRPSPVPSRRLTEERLDEARRRQEEVMTALPEELRARVESLLERRASGGELAPDEEVELRRLVREASLRATAHLETRLRP